MKKLFWTGLLLPVLMFAACDKDVPEEEFHDKYDYYLEKIEYYLDEWDGLSTETQYIDLVMNANSKDDILHSSGDGEINLYETVKVFPENIFRDLSIYPYDDRYFPRPQIIEGGEIKLISKKQLFGDDITRVCNSKYSQSVELPPGMYDYTCAEVDVEIIRTSFRITLWHRLTSEPLVIDGKLMQKIPRHKKTLQWLYPITDDFDWENIVKRPEYTY